MARLLVAPSEDVRRAVLPPGQGGTDRRGGLAARLRAAAGAATPVAVETLPCTGAAGVRSWFEHRKARPLAAAVLSLQPDVASASVTPEATAADLVALASLLEARFAARLAVLNCSSFDPADATHSYLGSAEPVSLRVHRFNLALIDASQRCGLSVVDVDNLVAEAGGAGHVRAALAYSPAVGELACDELARQLVELGVVASGAGAYALTLPRYDRRVTEAVVTAWHKRPGEAIAYGDVLLDLRADDLGWRLEPAARAQRRATGRSLALVVHAASTGVLRRVDLAEGAVAAVGDRIGVVTADARTDVPAGAATPPSFPTRVSVLA